MKQNLLKRTLLAIAAVFFMVGTAFAERFTLGTERWTTPADMTSTDAINLLMPEGITLLRAGGNDGNRWRLRNGAGDTGLDPNNVDGSIRFSEEFMAASATITFHTGRVNSANVVTAERLAAIWPLEEGQITINDGQPFVTGNSANLNTVVINVAEIDTELVLPWPWGASNGATAPGRLNIFSINRTEAATGPQPPRFNTFLVDGVAGTIDRTSTPPTITVNVPHTTTNLTDLPVTFTLGGDDAEVTAPAGTWTATEGALTFVDGTPVTFTLTPTGTGDPVSYEVTVNVLGEPVRIRTWDFTAWRPETLAALQADHVAETRWTNVSADRFTNRAGFPADNTAATAGNNPIIELDGLLFSGIASAASRLHIDHGNNPARIQLSGNNRDIVIPVQMGDIVTVNFSSSGGGDAQRGFNTPTGLSGDNNTTSQNAGAITNTYTATITGNAVLRSNAAINIHEITLSRIGGTLEVIEPWMPTLNVAGADSTFVLTPGVGTFAATVPYGTSRTALVPTFTLRGEDATVMANAAPVVSGTTALDFTSPVTFTLDWAGADVEYTVTITEATHVPPSIATFAVRRAAPFNDTIEVPSLNITNETIAYTFPLGTVLSTLVPIFTLDGDPAAVTVTGIGAIESGVTVVDFTTMVEFTLTPTVGTAQVPVVYEVTLDVAQDAVAPSFATFTVAGVSATVNNVANTITVEVPYAAGITNLVVAYTLAGDPATVSTPQGAVTSGTTEVNFTNPVVFTLTPVGAGDPVPYTVTVTRGDPTTEPVLAGRFDSRTNTLTAGTHSIAAGTSWATAWTGVTSDRLDFTATGGNVRLRTPDAEQIDGQGAGRTATSTQSFRGPIRVVMSVRAAVEVPADALRITHGTQTRSNTAAIPTDVWTDNLTFDFEYTGNAQISFPMPWNTHPIAVSGQLRFREIRIYSLPTTGPIDPEAVDFRWQTSAAVPAWVTAGQAIPAFDAADFSRGMLSETGDWFQATLPVGELTDYPRLASAEFRWGGRSAAVVVVEESVDGTTWTALDSIANNPHVTGFGGGDGNPGGAYCITATVEQGDAILFSMAGSPSAVHRQVQMARFQTMISPEARFVRYRMSQQTADTANFMLQALEIRDFTHSQRVMGTNFDGLLQVSTVQNIQGGTIQAGASGAGGVIANTNNPHPCPDLRPHIPNPIDFPDDPITNSSARINNDAGSTLVITPENTIRRPGVIRLELGTHNNNPINVRIQYSTNGGSSWAGFINDAAWVVSSGNKHAMYFEFPVIPAGITNFRFSRAPTVNAPAGADAGQRGDVTWFMFDIGVYVTPAPPSLALGTVEFNNETLHAEPWTFIVPNVDQTIQEDNVDITVAFPTMAEITNVVGFPASLVGTDTARVTVTVSAIDSEGLTGTEDHIITFARDTDAPTVAWQTPNNLGLAPTGTLITVWNKPIVATETTPVRLLINGTDATSALRLNPTGDTLRIDFTEAHWADNQMQLVIPANAFNDGFNNYNVEWTSPVLYTRDVIAPHFVSRFPTQDSDSAPMRGGIMLQLNEPMVTAGVNWPAMTLNGMPLVLGTSIWHFVHDGASVLVVPYTQLAANQTHTLFIPAAEIRDPGQNTLEGGDFTLTFTTGDALWLEGQDTFRTGDLRTLRGDFVQPSWITRSNRAALLPNNMVNAFQVIGYTPNAGAGATTGANISANHGFTWGDGGFHISSVGDTIVMHFANGVGMLDLEIYSNTAARIWRLHTDRWATDSVISVGINERIPGSGATAGHYNWDPMQLDLVGPTTVFLTADGGGYLWSITATAGPPNNEAAFVTFHADGQEVTVASIMNHQLWFGSDFEGIEVEFTTSHNAVVRVGGQVVESGDVVPFLTMPVEFEVTSEDGSTVNSYFVTFTIADAPEFATFNVDWIAAAIVSNEITAEVLHDSDLAEIFTTFTTLPTNAVVRIGETVITSPHTADFRQPVEITVQNPEGGARVTYLVTITQPGGTAVQDLVMEVVSFYPNPTTDVLNITAINIRTIEVINMMGQVVINTSVSGNNHTLDVSSLVPGLHFIRVTTDTGISVGRFIKQ